MQRVKTRWRRRPSAPLFASATLLSAALAVGLGCRAPPTSRPAAQTLRKAAPAVSPSSAPPLQVCPISVNACDGARDSECLEPVHAPPYSVRSVVYRYRDARQWNDGGKLPLPHFLLEHVKSLRRTYWRARAGSSEEQVCLEQLRAQVGYLTAALSPRGQALVWENMHGYAHALEQSEWAHLLASVASILGLKGHVNEARALSAVALRLAVSLDLPVGVRNGGVRSTQSTCSDSATEPTACFWFHSRGLGIVSPPAPPIFVLNEHLHAVFNSLLLYETLDENETLLLPTPADAERERRLALDRAVGGLYQLAFASGRQAAGAGAPRPNFVDFINRRDDICAHGRAVANVWTDYAIDPETGQTSNISNRGVCYYNAHMLQKLADIGRWLESAERKELLETPAGRRLVLGFKRLLAGAGAASSSTSDHALALFESAIEPAVLRARGCPQASLVPEVLPDEAFFLTELRKLALNQSACGTPARRPAAER